MLNPGEFCFWCMNRLPSDQSVCKACGHDNRLRKNAEGELPFALVAGKYLTGHALGRGGFGITYVGLNVLLEKRVAIKEYFPAELAVRASDGVKVQPASAEAEAAFEEGKQKALEEARTIARVQNVSNVVDIYDCFSQNNTVYIIMEFIEGESFASRVAQRGPLHWNELWPLIRPVGVALGQMHSLNLIHRDISPDNIMIRKDNGQSVLLDFGAASSVVTEGQEHRTALKDGYAAVEQYQGRAGIDGRADEYSWSASLWYMLTGSRPPNALQRRTEKSQPTMPKRIRSRTPEHVVDALLKGMAIRREDRYPTMEELILTLDEREAPASVGRKILMGFAAAAFAVMALALGIGLLT